VGYYCPAQDKDENFRLDLLSPFYGFVIMIPSKVGVILDLQWDSQCFGLFSAFFYAQSIENLACVQFAIVHTILKI
jgi:hypothetical protein